MSRFPCYWWHSNFITESDFENNFLAPRCSNYTTNSQIISGAGHENRHLAAGIRLTFNKAIFIHTVSYLMACKYTSNVWWSFDFKWISYSNIGGLFEFYITFERFHSIYIYIYTFETIRWLALGTVLVGSLYQTSPEFNRLWNRLYLPRWNYHLPTESEIFTKIISASPLSVSPPLSTILFMPWILWYI